MRIALLFLLCLGVVLAIYASSVQRPGGVSPDAPPAPAQSSEPELAALDAPRGSRNEVDFVSELGNGDAVLESRSTSPSGRLERRASGQVFDSLGRPTQAELLLVRPGGSLQTTLLRNQGRVFFTARDGRFTIASEVTGDFDLVALDGRTGWTRVPLGAGPWPTDMEVRLDPLPYVRGRIVGPDGEPRVAVRLDLAARRVQPLLHDRSVLPTHLRTVRAQALRPDAEGRFQIGPLAPGEYQLTVTSDAPEGRPVGRFDDPEPVAAELGLGTAARRVSEPEPPTVLAVVADLDVEREVVVHHRSTELWVRWFDAGSAAATGATVTAPAPSPRRTVQTWGTKAVPEQGRPMQCRVSSDLPRQPVVLELHEAGDGGYPTLVLCVDPASTLIVRAFAYDVPLVSWTVKAPLEGRREVIELAVPDRVPSVSVRITTVRPADAEVRFLQSELKRADDTNGPGWPLWFGEGVPVPLPEAHYTLHLEYVLTRASGSSERVERQVDLQLHGRSEFHASVDLGP